MENNDDLHLRGKGASPIRLARQGVPHQVGDGYDALSVQTIPLEFSIAELFQNVLSPKIIIEKRVSVMWRHHADTLLTVIGAGKTRGASSEGFLMVYDHQRVMTVCTIWAQAASY